MINLVKAELYRIFNRKFFYILSGTLVLFIVLLTAVMRVPLEDFIALSKVFIVLPVFLWPIITDAVIGEEFKDNTYINTVTYGVSKLRFYMAKVIVSCTIVLILTSIMVFFWYISTSLMMGGLAGGKLLINFLLSVLAALPLYLAAVIFSALLAFALRKNNLAMLFYWGTISFSFFINIVQQFNSIKFGPIYDALLTTQLLKLVGSAKMLHINTPSIKLSVVGGGITDYTQIYTSVTIGVVYILVFIVISVIINRKWK